MTGLDYITDTMERAVKDSPTVAMRGRVTQAVGTIIKALAPSVEIGELCHLRNPGESYTLPAEVVGFEGREALLTPLGEMFGVSATTEVIPTGHAHQVAVSSALQGRVFDGMGNPIDGGAPLKGTETYSVYRDAPAPLKRRIIDRPLAMGIRAIDGMLTCGEGQRMGIFAAAGGGKSSLLSMLVKGTQADITVLALIGERGREVREFIEHDLGEDGMKRSVIVVATSDKSSMERAKAAFVATAMAEYFRDQGKKVLFLMDSVTRFARAQREIGLAAGEPPTRRGFPPSVFATLPRLMERTGMSDKGSITALYTVLVEGDDMTEPIADETRSILDGHIILSRDLASRTHYPAIDILASASRVMNAVTTPDHLKMASLIRGWMAQHRDVELLLKIGEYQKGNDSETDIAIDKIDSINAFLRQGMQEVMAFDDTLDQMHAIVG
ncbi:MAG: type III secretion system ATPase SctN [Alphaproteobacteria bacterium GM202ARS2]|nr:type III secretion system ATPase SctN [Alphaproteobacteria bacterium GM202ARS2]